MAQKSLRTFDNTLRMFCLIGGICLLGSSLTWAQTFDGPTQVVANTDGSFQYDTAFTAGANGLQLAVGTIDGSENTDLPVLIADYFCQFELGPAESLPQGVSGKLLNLSNTGKVILSISPCVGDAYVLETTILPPPSLLELSKALEAFIRALPADVWRRPELQQTFLRKALRVQRLLARNAPCDMDTALLLLKYTMLSKTDGQNARYDWVIEPTSQQMLHQHLSKFITSLEYAMQERPACHQ